MTVTAILILVFVAIDVSIDNWIDSEFDNALMTKSNYLKTLVKVSEDKTDFDFSGEFMPEFSLPSKGEYFQLWKDGKSFERSESLAHFKNTNLVTIDLPLNSSHFFNVTLPDGRDGRAMVSNFKPQEPNKKSTQLQKEVGFMQLTIAISTEEVSNILIIIDSSLSVGLLLVIFIIRWAVLNVTHRGLKPLKELNEALKKANVSQTTIQLPAHSEAFSEIEPIKNELNKFITLNYDHLQNEKRITADIAHELKTPISELISLSEVHIRYPDDIRISETYKQDVLSISLKMKKIVSNLLLLQQSNSQTIKQVSLDMLELITQVSSELSFKYSNINERLSLVVGSKNTVCIADRFSVRTILINLLDNALFYSPDKSEIKIKLSFDKSIQRLFISIENSLSKQILEAELESLTLPLFQMEKSRSEQNRHGLGLTIVDNIARINEFDFIVKLKQPNNIVFSLGILV